MAVVLAPRVRRERETERVQVDRARGRVEKVREEETGTLPTAERVDEMVRAALTPHIGAVLEVRTHYQRGAKGETVTARLCAVCGHGALLLTERGGMPVWVSYRDLYAEHATVLNPDAARGEVQSAVGRLRRGAPKGDR